MNSVNFKMLNQRFHKSQHFDFAGGIPSLQAEKPGIGGDPLINQKFNPKTGVYPRGEGTGVPTWVAFDKQVLCFDAFFREVVPEALNESHRIRKCKICFFPEDDTIQVVEAEFKNSGISQGTLIHRQPIPLPPPNSHQFYNMSHLNINQNMVLFSQVFTVTNCDRFTRNFLTKNGVLLNEPTSIPLDPYTKQREEIDKSMKPRRPYERHDTLKQFLNYDPQVLRFYCIWNDTDSMFGDVRELVLHYFLADDTIEIYEVVTRNSGRDTVPKFLRRSKLPKHGPTRMKQPGEVTERTVLNVFTSNNNGKRHILDNLRTGAIYEEYYTDCDLMLGTELNVWGRNVVLCDCDDYTKEYYRFKYGIENFTPLQYKPPPRPKPTRIVPPYNGFGTEEDSLSSCRGLLLKPPKKDFRKFMEKDSFGVDQNVLKFRVRMVTSNEVDKGRLFTLSCYLCDDTLCVNECPKKNSGVIGGKFLERRRVKKPGQELFKSEPPEYFTAQDLYVGATISLNRRLFYLMDADEYTLNYMEKHPEEFPQAKLSNILSKLRSVPEEKQSEIMKTLSVSDPSNTGFISAETFSGLVMALDCGLTEHEVLVLKRCFSESKQPELDMDLVRAVAQDFLKKKLFDKFPDMVRTFVHQDRARSGRIATSQTRTICKACKLPLPNNLLSLLLSRLEDGGEIDYKAFLSGINWLENPTPPVMPEDSLKFNLNLRSDAGEAPGKTVNYSAFLQEVYGSVSNFATEENPASS